MVVDKQNSMMCLQLPAPNFWIPFSCVAAGGPGLKRLWTIRTCRRT